MGIFLRPRKSSAQAQCASAVHKRPQAGELMIHIKCDSLGNPISIELCQRAPRAKRLRSAQPTARGQAKRVQDARTFVALLAPRHHTSPNECGSNFNLREPGKYLDLIPPAPSAREVTLRLQRINGMVREASGGLVVQWLPADYYKVFCYHDKARFLPCNACGRNLLEAAQFWHTFGAPSES
jgi:hypothetical protein